MKRNIGKKGNVMTEFIFEALKRTSTKKGRIEICEDYLKLFVNGKQLRMRWKDTNSVIPADEDDNRTVPQPYNKYNPETADDIKETLDEIFG